MPKYRKVAAASAAMIAMVSACDTRSQSAGSAAMAADASGAPGPGQVRTLTGVLDGAAYQIELPRHWNGTLLLSSHGYELPPTPPHIGDDIAPIGTESWLLTHGYALAASAYSQTGWAVQQAFHDQMMLLDFFDHHIGRPRRTIADGVSMGGLITAGLVQLYPHRFAGGLSICGVVAGSTALFNEGLDGLFTIKTLLDPSGTAGLELPPISNPSRQHAAFNQVVANALTTPLGRARLALAAAVLDLPPTAGDAQATVRQQATWMQGLWAQIASAGLADLTRRAGGTPVTNTRVDYATQLHTSIDDREVATLYAQAGLTPEGDLTRLARATRITADPHATRYLHRYIQPSGHLDRPILTLHDNGDPEAVVENEQAYADQTTTAGSGRMLQQLYVNRTGHCVYTPAEAITALQQLQHRINTSQWGTDEPETLNDKSKALGASLNTLSSIPAPPAFLTYHPAPYLRPER